MPLIFFFLMIRLPLRSTTFLLTCAFFSLMIRRPPRSTLFPLHDALPIWWKADAARTGGDVFTANSSQIPNQFGAYSTPRDLTPFHTSASNGSQAPTNNTFYWQGEADIQTAHVSTPVTL